MAKTVSWRIIGTLDTLLISWLISSDIRFAFQIGLFELISKMVLYYFHERAWFKSSIQSSNKRHIMKTFSWRVLGTLDTILLSWVVTGNPLTGLKIGGAEVISKMILYFGHEKIWYQLDYGLKRRRGSEEFEKVK